jgi:hypothetical protein
MREGGRLRGREVLKILVRSYPTKSVNNIFNSLRQRERTMKNPLDSLWGTVIAGFVLTGVLYVFANNFLIGG